MRATLLAAWLVLLRAPGLGAAARECTERSVHQELADGKLVEVKRVAEVPPELLAALHLQPGQIADPGERWNPGCVQDGRTPAASLVLAARSRRVWVLVVLRGGIAVSSQVSVLCKDAGGWDRFRIRRPREPASERREWVPRTLAELRGPLKVEWIHREPEE